MSAGEVRGWWQFGYQLWQREAVSGSLRALLALACVMGGGWWTGQMSAVLPALLGVIASALAETDDSWRGRLRVQVITLVCFAVMALAVQASLGHPLLLGVLLAVAAIVLTLLGALGERYRTMAFATLVLAIYASLSSQPHAIQAVSLLWLGAAWYGLISVLWAAALPTPPVRQHLANLYESLGEYLRLKSGLLEPVRGADLEGRRVALALQNGRVVEALNRCKEALFSRTGLGPPPAWLLEAMQAYLVAQDVHERTSSSHEHYEVLAQHFFHSDVLYRCQRLLALLGRDCRSVARRIRRQSPWKRHGTTAHAIEDLQAALRHIELHVDTPDEGRTRGLAALHGLAANLGALDRALSSALQPPDPPADTSLLDRDPRSLAEAWQRLKAQMNWRAPLLRHALRLAVALTVGYGVMLSTGDSHGFWILLTIVFVCQPQYGATLTRLAQRVGGTVLGLVVGWALLRLFPDLLLQAGFTVAAGVLFFATRHTRYTLATAAITSLVLLSFNQAGDGFGLILPRLLDTVAGSVIAGLAVWLVLPSWQVHQLHRLAAQAAGSQANYLREIIAQYQTGKRDHLPYRLARRNAHNADAALSRALAAMQLEPEHARRLAPQGMRFLVLSHTLLNYLSALGAHRNQRLTLPEEGAAARGVNALLSTLDAVAAALEAQPPRVVEETALAPGLVETLTQPGPEGLRLVQAQLALCLRLLPALQAQAVALVAPQEAVLGEVGATGLPKTRKEPA
ncbi:YccS family putative transporter [Roseateles amylovorans]|uniref:YccS family putative transporter n=1 Tax=Roseateles amylovorans TaxID=2978473 RepID=A0ABY6ATL8_9BURK|nr:YccS family putative transporter [Roseateles amylovorans]UXH76574.1 YccS family putative transporter [Roseateles amylovorans]